MNKTSAGSERGGSERTHGHRGREALTRVTRRRAARVMGVSQVRDLVGEVFADLHSKRLDSLANATVGAMHASQASIHAIGAAYAAVAEIQPKHGVKQVDRYLSNDGFELDEMRGAWASAPASQ